MKKALLILFAILSLAVIVSCSNGKETARIVKQTSKASSVDSTLEDRTRVMDSSAVYGVWTPPTRSTMEPEIDLTKMSGPLVYSVVFNMMKDPDKFDGKVIKMGGAFDSVLGTDGIRRYACIVKDATACCAQGIEFTTTDDFKYPDDYPEMGDDVTVIGRFDIYYEGDFCFMTLLDARIVET
jgi:hypothetical protein